MQTPEEDSVLWNQGRHDIHVNKQERRQRFHRKHRLLLVCGARRHDFNGGRTQRVEPVLGGRGAFQRRVGYCSFIGASCRGRSGCRVLRIFRGHDQSSRDCHREWCRTFGWYEE